MYGDLMESRDLETQALSAINLTRSELSEGQALTVFKERGARIKRFDECRGAES